MDDVGHVRWCGDRGVGWGGLVVRGEGGELIMCSSRGLCQCSRTSDLLVFVPDKKTCFVASLQAISLEGSELEQFSAIPLH